MSGVWRAYVDIILTRLLSDAHFADATDEEIVEYLVEGAPSYLRFPSFERRKLVEEVAQRRGRTTRRADEPTEYAREMIPKIAEAYAFLARSAKRRAPSRRATATRAGVERETISGWVKRGWMLWPPT